MKKLSCLLIALIAMSGHAQKTLSKEYSYSISEPYRVFDAKKKLYFSKGNETMAVKLDGEDIMIQKFNNDKPAFISESKSEKALPKNYGFEDIIELNDKFYLFFTSWDGDNDKEQMFYQEIDFAKGEFTGKPVLMFQVSGHIAKKQPKEPVVLSGFGGMGGAFGAGDKFDIFCSQDKKSMLMQYRMKPEVKNDKKSFDIIGLVVFDANLKKLSQKEITMPYTERRMNNLDYKLDNKGNLYMLNKIFHDDSGDEKKKKKDTLANYHMELFRIKSGTDKIEISQFENNSKFITGLWMFETGKDYLVCGGYYSNGKGKFDSTVWSFGNGARMWHATGESDGIVVFKIRPDGTMYDQQYHEIPVEMLNAFEKKKTIRKNEKKEAKGISAKMPYLVLNDIQVLDDGGMMLVGEQYHMESHNSGGAGMGMGPGMGSSRNYYTYHYEDILVAKIAPDGSLSFMRKIPKNQIGSKGKGGMSYKYYFANQTHYLVFLDNVKNIDLAIDKAPAKHSDGQGGYLTAVKIDDATGDTTKGSVLNAREVDDYKIHQFSTNRIVKTGDNSFMVEAYKKGKEDIMIKVTLNK